MKNRLLSYINRVRDKNKAVVSELEDFLLPGLWTSSINEDVLYNTSKPPMMINCTYKSTRPVPRIKRLLYPVISRIYSIRIKSKEKQLFHGSEIIISTSGREYKIFDFENNLVLIRFKDSELRKKIETSKSNFSKSFYVPKTFHIDDKNKFIIEEYLPHEDFDSSYAFETMMTSYLHHVAHSKISYYESDYVSKCVIRFCKRFEISKVPLIELSLPTVMSHGDLISLNTIFSRGRFYVIDFERCKERYVFFDLFNYMFSEWVFKDNDSLLKKYFDGKYDSVCLEMAQMTGTEFLKEKRREYLFVFICLIYDERWRNGTGIDDKIYRFIKSYGII